MYLTLDCGVSVCVTDFHFRSTYGEFLEVVPNAKINDEIIQSATTCMEPLWGTNRPTYTLPPVLGQSCKYPFLPPNQLSAWLVCHKTQTHLIVVWFQDDFDTLPLLEVIRNAIRGLDWQRLSEAFEY